MDNWQFAWAEEQKKACCKTVGLGSPGDWIKMGRRNMDFLELQREITPNFFWSNHPLKFDCFEKIDGKVLSGDQL